MSPTDRNSLWADALLQELARTGVRELCVAPGSRSTPLVLAAARAEVFKVRVFLDERCAAFFALGVGKGSGMPAAVVTTSGTAVANLLPAVVEASQSETPLLVLTADRPHHLRDSDANQAIDQVGLFGSYTRSFIEVGPPVLSDPELRAQYDEIMKVETPMTIDLDSDTPIEQALRRDAEQADRTRLSLAHLTQQ